MADFDALLPGQTPLSDNEIAERILAQFRQAGVPAELLEDVDDGFEFIGPDSMVEFCGSPPTPAPRRVERVLGYYKQLARKAARDGKKRGDARKKGKASAADAKNKRALALITTEFPQWRSEPLNVSRLRAMSRFVKSFANIVKSRDALKQMLLRAKRS